jgi:hypothetical protein
MSILSILAVKNCCSFVKINRIKLELPQVTVSQSGHGNGNVKAFITLLVTDAGPLQACMSAEVQYCRGPGSVGSDSSDGAPTRLWMEVVSGFVDDVVQTGWLRGL